MNILFISPYVAWPLDHGGRIRTHHLLRALAPEHAVTNVAIARGPADRDHSVALAKALGIAVRPVLVPRHDATLPMARLAKWSKILVGRSSLPGRWHDPGCARVIRDTIEASRPQLAVIDSLWMHVYRDALRGIPYIASTHNVESDVLAAEARRRRGIDRHVAARDARLLARVEGRFAAGARIAVAVTAEDAARLAVLGRGARTEVVQNGVDVERLRVLPPPSPDGPLLFVGSFDYAANVDAARYLANDVLPAVRAAVPGTTAILAGRDPGADVMALARLPGVTVPGAVADVVPLYARASAAVVPVRVGGGSRIKILEALALGRPVVTTTAGARGLEVTDGVEVLVADAPDAFASAIARLHADRGLCERLVAAGRGFVVRRHAWNDLEARFAAIVATAGAAP